MLKEPSMQTILILFSPVRHIRIILYVSLLLIVGCTSHIPREDLFLPPTCNPAEDRIKLVTIPLPVIATSPNEGVTSGVLTAFLAHNSRDEVTILLAPQVTYNNAFGVTTS
ncbi:MAG: hypothetical protein WCI45_06360, partial [Desulfuromonadales bacterium]